MKTESDYLKSLEELAEAAEKVLSPEDRLRANYEHHCKPGDWFAIGGSIMSLVTALAHVGIGIGGAVGLAIGLSFLVGWALNHREEWKILMRVRAEVANEKGKK